MKSGKHIIAEANNYREVNQIRADLMRKIREGDKWMIIICSPERHFILLSEIESITIDE